MVDEPGFFSAEGFPYPLLALGQTFPRGYQYQSQMTPYKRDARGDWGRALNESIDQFFGMWPQYLQQKRQFALQRDQLARQRAADLHQAKLRPFELKQAQATQKLSDSKMQMLENYPALVEQLPVDDKYKAYLKSVPPAQGFKIIQDHIAKMMKPRTKLIKAGTLINGQTFDVDLQQKDDGTLIKSPVPTKKITVLPGELYPDGVTVNNTPRPIQISADNTISAPLGTTPQKKIVPLGKFDSRRNAFPEWQHPFLQLDMTQGGDGEVILPDAAKTASENLVPVPEDDPRLKDYLPGVRPHLMMNKNTGQIHKDPGFGREQEKQAIQKGPSPSQLFQTKHAGNKYAQVLSYADLAEAAGSNLDSQRLFAVSILPQGHPVRQRAQDDLNQKNVKMGRNGVFIPETFGKEYGKHDKKANTSSAPHSIPVNQGNSLDQIIADFKAKGITVDKTQVIAANKYFFPEGDENKMKTSAQVGGAEMLIPVGGGSLNETQVNAAHRSNDPRHNTTVIPGAGSYTNFNTTTVTESIKLNNDLADMKKLQSNVDQVVELMKDPNAISLMKTGHPARGLIEGLRWRLINNVQTLRDFGVLSPSEIDTIAKSVPDPNSFFNIVAGKAGLKPERFIQGVLGALKKEGETKASQLRAFMSHYGVQEIDFQIHQFNPYQNQDQNSQTTSELNTFR